MRNRCWIGINPLCFSLTINSKSMKTTYKGYNGTIVLAATSLTIKRGFKGFMLGGLKLRGNKTIPYGSIVAVQYKKAGFWSGYLQLSLRGGSEAKSGLNEALWDENTVTFQVNKSKQFWELKELIEQKIHATLAQLVERHIRNVQVSGSIPLGGSSEISTMVVHLLPKQETRVRFPHFAPHKMLQ